MGGVGAWLMTGGGVLLVLLVLRDVFDRLWHPSARGGLSQWLMAGVWRLTAPVRRGIGRSPRAIEFTGSAAMVTVVGCWVLLVLAGWTLIYLPRMPDAFTFATGSEPASSGGLLDAFYLSVVTMTTLGLGDVVPEAGWLRAAVPLEALMGFALLTAAVSWVLQVYPVLSRRRVLAARLSLVRRTGGAAGLSGADPGAAVLLLADVTADLVRVRVDLVQHAETYYVADGDREVSLAAALEVAVDLAQVGRGSVAPSVRAAAEVLDVALDDLARLVDRDFLHVGGPTAHVLDAYAADHGHPRT